jgi:CSLREA domain-containing protein
MRSPNLTRTLVLFLVFAAAITVLIRFPMWQVYAGNTITVNSTSDVANSSDGFCTLREAISAANNNAASGATAGECTAGSSSGSDAITFSVTGTINLTGVLPDLSSDMTITGPGSSQLTVKRNTSDFYRIFNVLSGVVSISGMTVTNGNPSGAAKGGGIQNLATLSLNDLTVTSNQSGTGSGAAGGGVFNQGTLTMTNSSVTGNSTPNGSTQMDGGGIANTGTLTLTNCTVNSNQTGNGTGSNGGFGGGIFNSGAMALTATTISKNLTGTSDVNLGGLGGGIYNSSASPVSLLDCTIADNNTGVGPGAKGYGGGIYTGAAMTITSSTISGNTGNILGVPSAGISNEATITLVNSTISGNHGNGIQNSNAAAGSKLTNCTITLNEGSGVGGAFNSTARNSIIAGNAGDDVVGTWGSNGHNLIGNKGTSTGFVNGSNGDQVGTSGSPLNPRLDGLFGNGGPTQTHALMPDSPALNAGDNCVADPAHCGDANISQLTTDQRGTGFKRLVGSSVDIGAFESRGFTTTGVTSSTNPSNLGQSITLTATVVSSAGTPTGTVQFKDGATNLGSPISMVSGVAQLTTSSPTAGTHAITANYSGDSDFLASSGTLSGGQSVLPALSINDVSATEGDSGTKSFTFTVTLSGASNQTVTVSYATADGTATTAGSDYVGASNTLTFNPGDLTKPIGVTVNGDLKFEPNETFFVNLSSPTNATISDSQGIGTIINDDAQGGIISFSQSNYTVGESGGSITITVNRTGDTSGAASVDYATPDDSELANVPVCATISGIAQPRCDFTTALGALQFAPGETSKTFIVLISQDNFAEGSEGLQLTLSNLTGGAVFGANSTAILTINDDINEPATNPNDNPEDFVRQHYHDFLNREPDASGLDFWKHQITDCASDPQCTEVRRVNVSGAFYLSIEFQGTGYLVERMYKTAFGDITAISSLGGAHQLQVPVVRFTEFLRDTRKIGQGVIVGAPGWENQLEANKNSFAAEFVGRSRFGNAYPTSLSPTDFVNQLFVKTGISPTPAERQSAVDEFAGAPDTSNLAARGHALRKVAENPAFNQAEFNRAFVLMQYFGYLRRNPNAEASADYTGYDFWLTKLNQFGGNFQNAEMVKAFISSEEYRHRFGP